MATTPMAQSREHDPGAMIAELQRKITMLETERNNHSAERDAALARETALAEVLGVINASPDNLAPVFEAILEKAHQLSGVEVGSLNLYEDGFVRSVAGRGWPSGYSTRKEQRFRAAPTGPHGLMLQGVTCHQIEDLKAIPDDPERPVLIELRDHTDVRTALYVPIRQGAKVLGSISAYRMEVRPFTAREIALLQNFAAQAVIAIENARLLGELRERTEALAQRNSEFSERIEQQSATIDVLKVMSASPGDPQPVFDLIAERARVFTGADASAVTTLHDGMLHLRAHAGTVRAQTEAFQAAFPRPLDESTVQGRAIWAREAVLVPNVVDDSRFAFQSVAAAVSLRSMAAMPMLRGDEAIGAIILARSEPSPFAVIQMELLQTFAEQAVIAITSADTYRELQERTTALAQRNIEFGEQIAHQAATIDVLKEMSASPGDAQPVFDLIVQRAREVCGAPGAALFGYDGALVHLHAHAGSERYKGPAFESYLQMFPMAPTRGSISCRAILDRRIFHVRDILKDEEIGDFLRAVGHRSQLSVPLLQEGRAIGAIAINGPEPGGFTNSQVTLLETFAEQAVIAITSAETYRALQDRTAALAQRNTEFGERIEQQSATIDVLKVMSTSPGNPQPVFDLITKHALERCNGMITGLFIFDDGLVHLRSIAGPSAKDVQDFSALFPMAPNTGSTAARAILEKRIIHVRDIDLDPDMNTTIRRQRWKSALTVPLIRNDVALGSISLGAEAPGGFTDSQVKLVQTFAEQAVIAISSAENHRALQTRTADLQASLERQTATSDILATINASPGDPQPVFDAILHKAHELCGAQSGALTLWDGAHLRIIAMHNLPTELTAHLDRPFPAGPANLDLISGQRYVHVPDMRAVDWPEESFINRALVQFAGVCTRMLVPMRKDTVLLGFISANRTEVRPFSEQEISLLENFAAQAVIAIENARLLEELRDRTETLALRNSEFGERIEQQSATIDVLKIMSTSPADPQPVFDIIARRAQELCNGAGVRLVEYDGQLVHLRAIYGADPAAKAAYEAAFPLVPTRGSVLCRAIIDQKIAHIRNMDTEPGLFTIGKNMGMKSVLAIPLIRDDNPIGAISIGSLDYGGFTDSQIALLQTFAEQAVIAITSAENHRALQARTEELTRSVAELQALEETIREVNSSLDLDTVLSTIISRAVELSQADEGTIYQYDDAEGVFVPKTAVGMSAERVTALRDRHIRIGETPLGRSAAQQAPLHIPNLAALPEDDGAQQLMADGIHAVLAVPLLREEKVIGGLVIRRRREGDFAPSVPTLLQTFAGQSVLAIENARLFHQLADRQEETRRAREAAEIALEDLRRAQDRLVQSEKMASLGQLTAGVAHEIKNPLNFVNNFSDLSADLLDELHEVLEPVEERIDPKLRSEIEELTATLKGNLAKIAEHGRRADSIVKNMLEHSRTGASERRAVDLNTMAEEALNLAYHGARAEIPGFNVTMETDLAPDVGQVELYPQEFTRVLVNLINNGFYAARKRAERREVGYEPTLRLRTRAADGQVEVRVRDNGTGIPAEMREKIFEPFFTTKPAGEGTGLGLSLSYDIVVKQHGGQLSVESEPGAFTEFTITLPRRSAGAASGAGERA